MKTIIILIFVFFSSISIAEETVYSHSYEEPCDESAEPIVMEDGWSYIPGCGYDYGDYDYSYPSEGHDYSYDYRDEGFGCEINISDGTWEIACFL